MIFILLVDRKLLRTDSNMCVASQLLLAFDRYIKKGDLIFPLYKAFLATLSHFFSYHIFQILSMTPS